MCIGPMSAISLWALRSARWRPWRIAWVMSGARKLIKIGAKVVRHGRYVTFQLAEIAIPRALFAEILRLIDRLRPAPLPP